MQFSHLPSSRKTSSTSSITLTTAKRASSKVTSKVRSLVTKFEALGRKAPKPSPPSAVQSLVQIFEENGLKPSSKPSPKAAAKPAHPYSLPPLEFEPFDLEFTKFDVEISPAEIRPLPLSVLAPLATPVTAVLLYQEEPAHLPTVLDPIDEDWGEEDDGASYCPSPAPPLTDDGEEEVEEAGLEEATGFGPSGPEDQGDQSILMDESVLAVEWAGTLLEALIEDEHPDPPSPVPPSSPVAPVHHPPPVEAPPPLEVPAPVEAPSPAAHGHPAPAPVAVPAPDDQPAPGSLPLPAPAAPGSLPLPTPVEAPSPVAHGHSAPAPDDQPAPGSLPLPAPAPPGSLPLAAPAPSPARFIDQPVVGYIWPGWDDEDSPIPPGSQIKKENVLRQAAEKAAAAATAQQSDNVVEKPLFIGAPAKRIEIPTPAPPVRRGIRPYTPILGTPARIINNPPFFAGPRPLFWGKPPTTIVQPKPISWRQINKLHKIVHCTDEDWLNGQTTPAKKDQNEDSLDE
ncbi:MAG: hypothetical protein M1816_001781 [Peltula sp. TS41687]|nr:MAG: hypothetical protein M1816_001781 [Peltula sp. TS41687]